MMVNVIDKFDEYRHREIKDSQRELCGGSYFLVVLFVGDYCVGCVYIYICTDLSNVFRPLICCTHVVGV